MTKKEIQLLFEYDTLADLKLLEVITALTGISTRKTFIPVLVAFKERLYIFYLPTKSGYIAG